MAKIVRAELNGKAVAYHVEKNSIDQHVSVSVPITSGSSNLRIHVRNDFGLFLDSQLPALGTASQGLRIVSESWTADSLTLDLSGRAGRTYQLGVFNAEQIGSVGGATLGKNRDISQLTIAFPTGQEYVRTRVEIRFRK
jgi:hypothetical protein